MYQPNKTDSIVAKYATIIEENKERRKYNGQYSDVEPEPLIYDESTIGDTDDFGNPVWFNWDYTNLISLQCIMDIFGDDYNAVRKMPCRAGAVPERAGQKIRRNKNGWFW